MRAERRRVWARLREGAGRLRRRLRGVEPRARVEVRCDRVFHGGWAICPQPIRRGDTVYSFGLGGDLAFERELAERYGARVFAFDPAPRAAEAAETDVGPPDPGTLRIFPLTVGGREERRWVTLPGGGTIEARAHRLPSHMRLLGHRRLDLIRLDVPGVEADVIRDLVQMDVDVQQMVVAFHEAVTPQGRDRIEAAIRDLGRHGYRIFHISPDSREYSFIRTDFVHG